MNSPRLSKAGIWQRFARVKCLMSLQTKAFTRSNKTGNDESENVKAFQGGRRKVFRATPCLVFNAR